MGIHLPVSNSNKVLQSLVHIQLHRRVSIFMQSSLAVSFIYSLFKLILIQELPSTSKMVDSKELSDCLLLINIPTSHSKDFAFSSIIYRIGYGYYPSVCLVPKLTIWENFFVEIIIIS